MTTQPAATPKLVTVSIQAGKPVGGVQTITAAQGQSIKFTVTADSADELHLHGYDRGLQLEPGKSTTLTLTADKAGSFEAELHGSDNKVFMLIVQPK